MASFLKTHGFNSVARAVRAWCPPPLSFVVQKSLVGVLASWQLAGALTKRFGTTKVVRDDVFSSGSHL
jgi:hypothetical protein